MINVLYTELLKLKRSKMLLLVTIAAIAEPGVMFLGWMLQQHEMQWEKYLSNVEIPTMLFLGVILFSVVAADIFSREYNDKTISVLYTYPNSRVMYIFSKFIVIYILIFYAYMLQFVLTIITGFGITLFVKNIVHDVLTLDVLSTHFMYFVKSAIMQFMLVPLACFIGILGKSIVASTVYGILVGFGNIMLVGIEPKIAQYYPWAAPAMTLFSKTKGGEEIILMNVGISVIIAFVIGCILCLSYSLKEDIN